jgi:hypothetical protein
MSVIFTGFTDKQVKELKFQDLEFKIYKYIYSQLRGFEIPFLFTRGVFCIRVVFFLAYYFSGRGGCNVWHWMFCLGYD